MKAAETMAICSRALTSGASNAPTLLAERIQRLDTLAKLHSGEPLVFTIRAQLRMMLGDRAGALDDLKAFGDLTDYVPESMLRQIIAMLTQAGRQDDAKALEARLPKAMRVLSSGAREAVENRRSPSIMPSVSGSRRLYSDSVK